MTGRLIAEPPLERERASVSIVYCGQPLRPRERARPPSARPCSPYLGGIALHVPALGKPILPISLPSRPQSARLPRSPPQNRRRSQRSEDCAGPSQRPIPSPSPLRYIHLVDAETKHPTRRDVDDMRCTPCKTAGEWSPQRWSVTMAKIIKHPQSRS